MSESIQSVQSKARNIPLEAAYFREALRIGVATLDEVVLWSDQIIAESEVAEDPFVELSFALNRHPLTAISQLESLSLGIETLSVLPVILGLAYRKLLADPQYGKVLAKALCRICVQHGFNLPIELRSIYGFDDAYDLASAGHFGTEEGVLENLRQFTSQFEERAIQISASLPLPLKTGFPPSRE
jgi:hypothetical protein